LEKYSSDAVRYWAASAQLGVDTRFDEGQIKVGKRLVTKLFNAGKLVRSLVEQSGTLDVSSRTDRVSTLCVYVCVRVCVCCFSSSAVSF
jgi:valyl-tRNA synthetase